MEKYHKQKSTTLPLSEWVEVKPKGREKASKAEFCQTQAPKPLKRLNHQPLITTRQRYAVLVDEMENAVESQVTPPARHPRHERSRAARWGSSRTSTVNTGHERSRSARWDSLRKSTVNTGYIYIMDYICGSRLTKGESSVGGRDKPSVGAKQAVRSSNGG